MKKYLAVVFCLLLLIAFGCTSIQQQLIAQKGIVKVLQNKPKYIEPTINGLTVVSDYLKCGVCGVADLKAIIAKSLPKEYAADISDIIMLSVDDPMLTSTIDSLLNHNLKPETIAKLGVFVDGLKDKIKAIQA